jgi:hypothetical protein
VFVSRLTIAQRRVTDQEQTPSTTMEWVCMRKFASKNQVRTTMNYASYALKVYLRIVIAF